MINMGLYLFRGIIYFLTHVNNLLDDQIYITFITSSIRLHYSRIAESYIIFF